MNAISFTGLFFSTVNIFLGSLSESFPEAEFQHVRGVSTNETLGVLRGTQ